MGIFDKLKKGGSENGKSKRVEPTREQWREALEYAEEQQFKCFQLGLKFPKLIERGKSVIYPQRQQEWETFMEKFAESEILFWTCEPLVEILEGLENGMSFEDVTALMHKYDWKDYQVILRFSKRGPEFFRYIARDELSEKHSDYIAEIEAQNAQFEQELNPESGDDE